MGGFRLDPSIAREKTSHHHGKTTRDRKTEHDAERERERERERDRGTKEEREGGFAERSTVVVRTKKKTA